VNGLLPVVLCAAGGALLGSAWSLRSQGAGPVPVGLVGLLAVLAVAAGVFSLLPKGTFS
jgi:hypothetical protein